MRMINSDPVAVVCFNNKTGYIETVTSCDREDAWRYAKYYRSKKRKVKIVEYDLLEQLLQNERIERAAQRRMGNVGCVL